MNNYMALLFLRLTFGGIMLFNYGLPKLLNFSQKICVFSDYSQIDQQGTMSLAIFIEVFCISFLMIGLFVRLISIILIVNIVITLITHNIIFKQEAYLMFLFGFITIYILKSKN